MIRRCFSVHLRNTILFISVQGNVFVCVCEGMTHFLTLCSLMTLGMNISGKSHLSPVSRQVAPWVCRLVWSKSTFGSFAEFIKPESVVSQQLCVLILFLELILSKWNQLGICQHSALFPHLLYFSLLRNHLAAQSFGCTIWTYTPLIICLGSQLQFSVSLLIV